MTSAALTAMHGQVVAITGVGATGQVGSSLAVAFAARGAIVHLIGRSASVLADRRRELAGGAVVHLHAADLSDAADVERVASGIAAATGAPIHALVHAAGGFASSGPVAGSDPTVWHTQFAINATTAYLTTRALLPGLRAGRGSIVYFASAAALPAGDPAGIAGYASAKAAVIQLMRAVAREEAGHGVRANALAPGAIRTPANERAMDASASYVEMTDVERAVMFLVSGESRGISGQVIELRAPPAEAR